MKRTIPLIICGGLWVSAAVAQAEQVVFKPDAEHTDSFLEAGRKNMMKIEPGPEGQGLLTFRSEGGGTMLTLAPDQKELISAANEVEIDFRAEGTTTFGIFLRGQGEGGDAYMAFISASAEKTLMLYLCKTKQSSMQQPSQTAIASKHIQTYIPGNWCKLKLSLKDHAGQVTFAGALSESDNGQNLIELSAEDSADPITQPGAVVFRLNGDKAKGGGLIQIRSITITP